MLIEMSYDIVISRAKERVQKEKQNVHYAAQKTVLQQDLHKRLRVSEISTELQTRGGIEDNSKIIFLISHKNICCDSSLEQSQRDSSMENMANYS